MQLFRTVLLIGMVVFAIQAQVYYSENFEGTPTTSVSGGGWEYGVPTSGPTTVPEGTRCAGTILSGNYSNSANYYLITPSINLPDIQVLSLSFYEWYSTESGYDYIYIEIEQNNSGSWSTLRSRISGSNTTWTTRTIDLSSYRNSSVRIRFRLSSDPIVPYPGWFVDQIRVYQPVTYSLALNAGSGGTITTPSSSPVNIESGMPYTITATPATGYRFANWAVTSGSATFNDATAYATTVTISNDAAIRANFTTGTVYNITTSDQQFNYTTHYYQGVTPGTNPGVAFRFTAPSAGSYTIIVDDVETSSKYLYDYGTNATFSSYSTYSYGTGIRMLTISAASAGEVHYFGVRPSSSSYYTNNFTIRYGTTPTLTITNDGHGTTSPTGSIAVTSGVARAITATPGTGYRFNNWTVTSGSATFADANAYSTSVTIPADATIRANFTAGTIYQILSSNQQYDYVTHHYQGTTSTTYPGVAFQFTAPAAGSYAIVVENVQNSAYKYLYDYGTTPNFSSSTSIYRYGSGTLTLAFTASAANETHYFGVRPSSTSYETYDFYIRYETAPTLTITNSGNGTTTPSGDTAVASGTPLSIYATAATGYRFDNWTVTAGGSNATITNPNSYSTSVTCTGDATVQANFSSGSIYAITSTAQQYNYTTNYYQGTSPGTAPGVAFQFTAPAAGSYAIVVDDVESATKYLYDYGANGTFSSASSSSYGSGTISLTFTAAAAGEIHYFGVRPTSSSYYTYNFTIRSTTVPTLTVTNDGNGTTSPTGSISVVSGVARSIYATPNGGYRFNNWTVTTGSATFADATLYSTTATITADATIRANFTAGVLHPITATNQQYNFTTDYYQGTSPGTLPGVAFEFTAPAAGAYSIVVEDVDVSYKYLYDYGSSATFSSYSTYTYGTGTITQMFSASAAGEKHYFSVRTSSSTYYTNNFNIRYVTASMLTVEHSGIGTTTPSGNIALLPGAPQSIYATPTSSLSYFDHWSLVSGNAAIANTTIASTSVSVSSGNAVVRAVFLMYPVDTLIVQNDGNGFTYPTDTVFILSGNDTTITATPNGGYVFTSWSAPQGTAIFGNATNATTTASVSNGKATVQANFTIDPNVQPTISISDINISSHPDICVTASVVDTGGRSITGLDSSFFTLREDGSSLPFQLTTVTQAGGTSVTLVIDTSGSMSGTPVQQAVSAAQAYINSMNPNDRCAIVAFAGGPRVVQTMTSDQALLNSRVSTLTGSGGTSILSGANLGVEQLLQETNSRAVIIFSDGSGTGTPALDSVVNYARHNNVTIYSIGIGSATTEPLKSLADSTGGTFTTAPSAAELESIYAQIKRDIEARYILCYQTPDLVFNGDTHTVVVSVTMNTTTSRDTTTWNESNHPPVITLTPATQAMIGVNQPVNTAIPISAEVTDDGTVSTVRLFYRLSGSGSSYTEVPMPLQSGTTYQATVPAGVVLAPGIDFYIIATDNFHLVGRSPNVNNPANQPWVIPVDNQSPVITHTVPSCLSTPANTPINAVITDNNTIATATLFYKRPTDALYQSVAMSVITPDNYRAVIPAAMITSTGADYYLQAADNYGVTSRLPQTGSYRITLCNNNPPDADAGADQTVSSDIACEATVTLDGSGSTDPDGGSLTYSWSVTPGNQTLTGATPAITLQSGVYQVILMVTDNGGNQDLDTATITVIDDLAPVVPALSSITGECSVTITAPTAYDNCSGAITGTTTDPLSYSSVGTYTINWTFTDGSGNSASASQVVVIEDNAAPVPDAATLPTVTGECAVTVTTIPTASDNCTGGIVGSTADPLEYTSEGTYTIHWSFTDVSGNTATQNQIVEVHDVTAPVPDAATLPKLTGECFLEITSAPTATDNCLGTVTGTTDDPLTYSTAGAHTIHWVFTDYAGNTATQEQAVSIYDATGPDPDRKVLDYVTGECSVTISTIPTATDGCDGSITATTSDPLSYSGIGTHTVRWTYTDDAGNSTTQEQMVEVTDATPPEPAVATLPDVIGECSVTLTPPTAEDQCSGTITGTTGLLTFNTQGTFTVEWTYTDSSGNSSTQEQTVIVQDTTAPSFTAVPSDTSITVSRTATGAEATLSPATASDNCSSADITAHRSDDQALDTEYPVGTTTVIWQACDDNGNCDSTEQQVTVITNRAPVLTAISDTTIDEGDLLRIRITATDSDQAVPTISAIDGLPSEAIFTDSGNGAAGFLWETGCVSHGIYTITFVASDGMDTDTMRFTITVQDINYAPRFISLNDTTSPENSDFTLLVRTEDCDGDIPKLRAVSIPTGSTFQDNGDGTASLIWTPECDENGFYIVVFEVTDDHTAVQDTMLLRITDVNCFDPQLTLSAVSVSTGINLPVTIAIHATDDDNTIPLLEAENLPTDAGFEVDDNGNAVFSWTPGESGTYHPVFIAVDADDPQIRIDTTVTITVSDDNFTGPSFLPCNDTIIDENQLFSIEVYAEDPDGTIPEINDVELPEGATFTDNDDGSATISWTPGCTAHGNHLITVYATDGVLTDTLDVLITVRDQNCPPIINPITDKSIAYGGTVRFSVSATDPDEDMLPDLSIICSLPGYTFSVPEKGTGTFEWKADYASGSYPVTFIADDGYASDTETVMIAVNQSGSVSIVAEPSDASLYLAPAAGAQGSYIGSGTATLTLVPGTYWFRAEASGYRPSLFTGTVTADETCSLTVTLRPLIPQAFSIPETLSFSGNTTPEITGSITFTDFDGDGIQDLSVAGGNSFTVYTGSDSSEGLVYRTPAISVTLPSDLDSIVAHTYTDWDNDGRYECLLSLAGGTLLIGSIINEEFIPDDEIISSSDETLFPAVTDIDGDKRKDLVVIAQGENTRLYFNTGSDSAPAFDSPVTVSDDAGDAISGLASTPLIWDINGDGSNNLIVQIGHALRLYSVDPETPMQQLSQGEDLNAGGTRIDRDGTGLALCLLPRNFPRLAVLTDGKILLYPLQLQGDINGDGTVNISDISKIAKAWELTEDDPEWNPACNLRLSPSGNGEVIDIGDISRASKNWELQE